MQVVRTGPDIQENQCPKVDDRQLVTIDRLARLFEDKVIHHPQKPGGQEKPVGDVDVWLGPRHQGAQKHHQIGDPNHGQPQIDVPFRFGIFQPLGHTHQVSGRGQHDEHLVSPEHEPTQIAAPQPHRTGALDDVKRRADQRVTAKGKDDGTGVQRAQPAKVTVPLQKFKVQRRKRQLKRDDDADQKPGQPPKRGGNHACADHRVIIPGGLGPRGIVGLPDGPDEQPRRHQHDNQRLHFKPDITRPIRSNRRQQGGQPERCYLDPVPHLSLSRLVIGVGRGVAETGQGDIDPDQGQSGLCGRRLGRSFPSGGPMAMGYKTISVTITDSQADAPVLAAAAALALREGAHLDVFCIGVDPARYVSIADGSAAMLMELGLDEARKQQGQRRRPLTSARKPPPSAK